MAGGTLDRRDIELLIERIDVDKEGMPEITLKYGLSDLINYSPADEMNRPGKYCNRSCNEADYRR